MEDSILDLSLFSSLYHWVAYAYAYSAVGLSAVSRGGCCSLNDNRAYRARESPKLQSAYVTYARAALSLL